MTPPEEVETKPRRKAKRPKKTTAAKKSDSREDSSELPQVYSRDQHTISRKNIDPDALKIMYRLLGAGRKAYLVGGGVRDLLLNKRPKDFDIVTDALPRQIRAIFRNSRIIGRRFKLVHVYFANNKIIEVSTFRDENDPESSADPDRPQLLRDNNYGDESTDAVRRDLTINGLFYDLATFSVIDYVGGLRDLQAGIIKIIGDPTARFLEDPVRMIRAIRHAARTNFIIEPKCWEAVLQHRELLMQSPPMRVYEELKKDLCSGYAHSILKLLAQSGILELLLPELTDDNMRLLSPGHAFSRLLKTLDTLARSGQTFAPTVPLTLVSIFRASGEEVADSALESLSTQKDLNAASKNCFEHLAVPKREKDRIKILIELLVEVRSRAPENIPTWLRQNALEVFEELQLLVDLFELELDPRVWDFILKTRKRPTPRRSRGRKGPRSSSKRPR